MINRSKVITSTTQMSMPTVVVEIPQVPPKFARTDFIQAPKKVSRKRLPVGEHIREAIQTIRGSNA